MKHFPLDKNYASLLKSYGISIDELLKRAQLPLDLFMRKNPCVTAEEYYRFMKAIEDIVSDKKMPILLATAENIETITPPIFGAYCSANARECIKRIKEEDTTFQKQLNHVRELLAKNYIQNTELSSEDIAYLLGYQDLNSFFRAFSLWTGMPVTAYKRSGNSCTNSSKSADVE